MSAYFEETGGGKCLNVIDSPVLYDFFLNQDFDNSFISS